MIQPNIANECQVLIIGSGPSGMVSALCLAHMGVSSILVERNAKISTHPKAHELNARSIEILTSLGIHESELHEEAAPFRDGARILFCHTINEEYGRIDLYADKKRATKYQRHIKSSMPYLNLSQTELEKILLKHVKENPLITIFFNHKWENLHDDGHNVIHNIVDLKTKKTTKFKSQYTIAADGAGSRCRQKMGIRMVGPERMDDFASAYFESNLRDHIKTPAKLYWILNPRSPGTFIAHHIEKRWVFMTQAYLDYQKKKQFSEEFFIDKIRTALGDKSIEIDIKSISFWRMSAQLADTYRKGKTFLVGDAAHRFPPTGGLGMNTGIADAHNLSWKMGAVLNHKASEQLLDTYESERKPIAAENTKESVRNYHKILEVPEALEMPRYGLKRIAQFKNAIPTKWLPEKWKESILSMIIERAEKRIQRIQKDPKKLKNIKNVIADQISHFDRIGLDIGYYYKSGAVIHDGTTPPTPDDKVTQYFASTYPGARLPHLAFQTDNGLYSTHDLIEFGKFTMLVWDKSPWKEPIQELSETTKSMIKLYNLGDLALSEEDREALYGLCDIEKSGVLLVRPDGHIAWRRREVEKNHSIKLKRAMNEILRITEKSQVDEK